MRQIVLTGGAIALLDDDDYDQISRLGWPWHVMSGYASHSLSRRPWRVLMHRHIMQPPPGTCIDHINRNKLDNRRLNLRLATNSLNSRNVGPLKNNTSGVRGVWLDKHGKWCAETRYLGKKVYLGRYEHIEDAAAAYQDFDRQANAREAARFLPQK